MSELLNVRKLSLGVGVAVGSLLLNGCGSPGQPPEVIEVCTDKQAEGTVATVDSGDIYDPEFLLDYISEARTYYIDREGEKGFGQADIIDGLGEVVCRVGNGADAELHILPGAQEAIDDYLGSPEYLLEQLREDQN